jgi:eukaryotic-like serine/threonine-protein kinase
MPLQPNTTLGPYVVTGFVGEGGMGAVYRAKDTRLGREVAIKVLTNVAHDDRERLARFEQEARATGMLNHPNLLTVYDVGRDDDGNPFLVCELLEGETLTVRLARGPLSPRKAVDAALQMAKGLAAAHEKGIVHRDLKPDNIFLTRDGRLKILDFGIAKLTGAAAEGPTFEMAATEPGMVLGTVGYMSPEQVRGEPVDQRSDIFSLGAILYEMLAGIRAFKRTSSIETLSAILREEPQDLTELFPSLPPALEKLVRRCLEKDRENRFHSAHDLAFNLETLTSMSTANTLTGMPGVARSVTGATTGAIPTASQLTAAQPARTMSTPTVRHTVARPIQKPKRRVSGALLALLYLVSIAGAAYAGWVWANRRKQVVLEPQFHRLTFRRGDVRAARFSSDGETIVYSAAWDGRPSEIFIAGRRAPDARALGIADAELLSMSQSTELAILLRRDRVTNLGTLARVPLAGGIPREIAENVVQADWSPDGANLAIIRQVGDKNRVEYPIGTVRHETLHYVRDVRVAPDGRRLAILEPSQGQFDLAVIDKGKPVTIAKGWARGATGLAWSPDGSEIWVSGTASASPPALYAVNVATGAIRLVCKLTGSIRLFDLSQKGEVLLSNVSWRAALVWKPKGAAEPASPQVAETTTTTTAPPANHEPQEHDISWLDWSILADLTPDGKNILFSETREGGGANNAVYLRRADTATPVRLGDGMGDGLSPDGRWALCHQGPKLVLIPTGTGEPRELKIAGQFDSGAAWLPDSRRALVAGVMDESGYRLYLIDTLDETAKPVSPASIWGGGSRAFAVSPDGRIAAGMSAEQTIVLYAIDGSGGAPLPGAVKGEIPIQWSADGASLFVYEPTSLPARVSRVTVATGARELWKEFTPADPAGVTRIAPVIVTPDAGAYAYNAIRSLSDLYVVEGIK